MVKGMGEGLWRRLRLRNCEVDLDGFTSKMRSNRELVEQAKGNCILIVGYVVLGQLVHG